MTFNARTDLRQRFHLRVMACMVAALLVVIGFVRLWPVAMPEGPPDLSYHAQDQEVIGLEEIKPTRQASQRKPPPPAPQPPVVVPDDVFLEDVELKITDSFLPISEPGDDTLLSEGEGDAGPATTNVFVAPKPVRFVEPEYTREARRKKVRAEVVIKVLVDEKGRVQETAVVERFLISDDELKEPVAALGFGLEEAATAAAIRWQFRPARKNGKPVSSYTTVTFSFGV